MSTHARHLALILAIVGAAVGLELGLEQLVVDEAWRQIVLFTTINVVVALSLNVINGLAGQFSIGHAGFVGIGAYTAALVVGSVHERLGADDVYFNNSFIVMPLAIVAAAAVAGLFGLVVGLPSLRLKGDYLAIVTLGFAEIFRLVIATARSDGEGGVGAFLAKLGGQNGYAGLDGTGLKQYAGPFWIFLVAGLTVLACWRMKFSGWGRALRALREDEVAAAAVGVDPTRYKVTSFVLAAVGGGVAGALLATMRGGNFAVTPDQFTFAFSFEAITMVILGGSGSVSGSVVGAVIVTVTIKLIDQLGGVESVRTFQAAHPTFDLPAVRMVAYALILIILMVLRPEGLFGERELGAKRSGKPGGPEKPSSPPDEAPTSGEAEAGAS
jgi:branched-chain amino acid transport system permease protein